MDRFVVEILPVVVRFAEVCFHCPDKQSLTLTLAWYSWFTASAEQQKLPASVWARSGVRQVLRGRDLPGIGAGVKDALNRAQQGAAMEGLADKSPGPEQIVMNRERYERVLNRATDREREMIVMLEAEKAAKDIAAKLEITQGRVSQLRRGLIAKGD